VFVGEGGVCSFRVYLPEARRVEIVGDFTGWETCPIEMSRDAAGWWIAREALGGGEHEFQYLIDGRDWLTDFAAGGIRRNLFGAWVSVVSVEAGFASLHAA